MRYILISSLHICVFVLCASLLGTSIDTASADDSLDGKTFIVELSESNKDETSKDELIFKDGTFFSAECEQYGFTPTSYESKSKGDTILFESTANSDKEGKTEWEGSVNGDEISGTMIWSKQGQDPIIYTYKGIIKQ